VKTAIVGCGKVGGALARATRAAGLEVETFSGRKPPPVLRADLVVIATRDETITPTAARMTIDGDAAVVHCAGALGPEALAPLRRPGVSLGVMHPAISLVDDGDLLGGVVISGDPAACDRARSFATAIGLAVVMAEDLDRPLYHAAMALVANGGAALAAAASDLAARAGLEAASQVIGPLLVSVGRNVERLGAGAALSGPVRRGSVATIRAHLEQIALVAPEHLALYRALVRAQLPLARSLGEATPSQLEAIERAVEESSDAPRPDA
jgi:predicted short-subunit dehydrogenase-like oxidoreductase (DUF2520 family)